MKRRRHEAKDDLHGGRHEAAEVEEKQQHNKQDAEARDASSELHAATARIEAAQSVQQTAMEEADAGFDEFRNMHTRHFQRVSLRLQKLVYLHQRFRNQLQCRLLPFSCSRCFVLLFRNSSDEIKLLLKGFEKVQCLSSDNFETIELHGVFCDVLLELDLHIVGNSDIGSDLSSTSVHFFGNNVQLQKKPNTGSERQKGSIRLAKGCRCISRLRLPQLFIGQVFGLLRKPKSSNLHNS